MKAKCFNPGEQPKAYSAKAFQKRVPERENVPKAERIYELGLEPHRLIQELHAYQVELEFQNDELRNAQVNLEKSRDSYSNLFEFSPSGYLLLDGELRITKVNVAAAELLGQDCSALVGRTCSQLVTGADGDLVAFHFRKVRASGRRESTELHLVRSHGTTIPVQIIPVQIHTQLLAKPHEPEVFLMSISDITAQEDAKQVVQEAKDALEIRIRERTHDLELANRALAARMLELRNLSKAVEQSRSSILIADVNGVVEYVNPRFVELTGYSLAELSGKRPHILSDGIAPRGSSNEIWATIGCENEWRGTRQDRTKGGRDYWEELCISAMKDERGQTQHYLYVGEDVTERKALEANQQLLMFELDHRVKNTLSVVIAIAKQTAKTSDSLTEFRKAFEGRLMALAEVHRLLTKNSWQAVLLSDLIHLAVKPYVDACGPTVTIEGPEVKLDAQDAQSLHLTFHELATNASKYGAFSVESGRIAVVWQVGKLGGAAAVRIAWTESHGPPVTAPQQKNFGHRAIEQTIVHGFGGQLTFRFPASGFEMEAILPLPEIALSASICVDELKGDLHFPELHRALNAGRG